MELDARKQRILQAIVQDYVATAEPVGSHVLVQRYSLGVKSATIRNEMAEMSERGYLRQPHTSAGRVPSDLGYRFYVNRLMPLPVIQPDEAITVRDAVATASSELDAVLRKTCSLLAAMTRLPAVATSPDADDTELRQVFVSPAGADKLLLVLLFSTGRTENRLLSASATASDALVLANALNDRFGGEALTALRAAQVDESGVPNEMRRLAPLWSTLSREIVQAARALGDEMPMYVEGTHAVLEHPEFRDVERLGQFLSTLQERAALLEMMGQALDERPSSAGKNGVQVVIGEENSRPFLQPYSVVSSPYFVGDRERGAIGVLGPTRMDYGRAAASVAFMARTLGDLLTRLSFSR
uniref:Heat-inducible transcription repressor HrcA n=1 Tax=uncultured Armatimonadetes bacterium TaxID=157466 RepID=A0A6J4JM60_9BACT|nr:Heat-inducible transcription repressor HrcA [uncultured Armatimonadetes bacterium]